MIQPNELLPALHTTGTFPELAVFNHNIRMEFVIKTLSQHGMKQVLDIGCGDGAFAKKIVDSNLVLDGYLGLDPWAARVEEARASEALSADWLHFQEGSMTELERVVKEPSLYRSFGAVVLIETIEHVPLEVIPSVEQSIFGDVEPALVIITTPDATTRLTEEKMQARGHHFEWDIPEFADWVEGVVSEYPYDASIQQLSGPSFMRNTQTVIFKHR